MPGVLARSADAHLCIVGDGELRPSLERQAAQEGIAAHVTFAGSRDNAEIADWIGAAHVLCLPSLREGCPNVVLEALACGRPVVASAVGAIPDMLDARCGLLCEPGDPAGFADALARALEQRWNAAEIRATVAGCSWRAAAQQYRDLAVAALGPDAPRPARAEELRIRT
jgi:glycosyltransferase involved in cell wall biosynthesis